MAFSKAHKFDDAIYHFSLMCRALSHPARVMILKRLIALHGDRAKAGDLTRGLPITQQALSQHFRILRDMSVLKCEEEYPHVYYALNNELFNTFVGIFGLVTQADLKHDVGYKNEIIPLSKRRTTGTAPV